MSIIVKYISHMGDERSIANAARVSFSKDADSYTEQQNHNLIKYLATGLTTAERNELTESIIMCKSEQVAQLLVNQIKDVATHWTPFAHTAISLSVTAPLPIRTHCFKHKAGLVENEESRRYIVSTPEVHIPEFRLKPAKNIKQGSGGMHPGNIGWQTAYKSSVSLAVETYEAMVLDCVAPEQARYILPQGTLTTWVWTGNLYAFANFVIKRSDKHAQKEVQDIAKQVKEILTDLFPVAFPALLGEF